MSINEYISNINNEEIEDDSNSTDQDLLNIIKKII